MSVEGFIQEVRSVGGVERSVFFRRNDGPGVVVLHEVPGITPEVARLARIIADAGYSVAMPTFFGVPGKPFDMEYAGNEVYRLCVNREFNIFAVNGSSPVVDWIRRFCVAFYGETASPYGVGVIGLCVTGGFALASTVDSNGVVQAPVVSEPATPFPIPFNPYASGMNLSLEDQQAIAKQDIPVVGLRFTNDAFCPRERFDSFERLLGPKRFKRIEIESPNPALGIPGDAHSVLTVELQENVRDHPTRKALDEVIAFLDQRLRRR